MKYSNFSRICNAIYYFSLSVLLFLIGLVPLSHIGPQVFLVMGSLSFIAFVLFLTQWNRATEIANMLIKPIFATGWKFFTIAFVIRSLNHHPESSPWPEVLFNFMISVSLGIFLAPLFRLRERG